MLNKAQVFIKIYGVYLSMCFAAVCQYKMIESASYRSLAKVDMISICLKEPC